MEKSIFSEDYKTEKKEIVCPSEEIKDFTAVLSSDVSDEVKQKGEAFSREITENFFSDFEKTEDDVKNGRADVADKMVHVSTFCVVDGFLYVTYYANVKSGDEDPNFQTARLCYCPVNEPDNKTFLDVQSVGDFLSGKRVNMVYDTILAKYDDGTLFVLWTAKVEDKYYRLYRTFDTRKKEFGEIGVNRLRVGNIVNDFSTTGIISALTENGLSYKTMYSDIGIMQKFTERTENGEVYYYSGAYSGDFNFVIKSKDFIEWQYVSAPGFLNDSKWENATYVSGDKCFYFVRQNDRSKYGFLTVLNLKDGTWEKPTLIEDCQSRSDFISYNGNLYLFHAPVDRNHIGIVKVNTENISESEIVLQAKMDTGCFYPFIRYFTDGELAMSYTVDRKHIRLARFTLKKYL